MEQKIIFKIPQVATYLHTSEYSIRKMCREKTIPHFRIGTNYLFDKAVIDEWLYNKQLDSITPSDVSNIANIGVVRNAWKRKSSKRSPRDKKNR